MPLNAKAGIITTMPCKPVDPERGRAAKPSRNLFSA